MEAKILSQISLNQSAQESLKRFSSLWIKSQYDQSRKRQNQRNFEIKIRVNISVEKEKCRAWKQPFENGLYGERQKDVWR